MRNAITLQQSKMPLVEFMEQRVVTFAMVDEVHQRPKGTAKAAFNRNRSRFVKGRHFFELTGDVIRTQSLSDLFPPRTGKAIVITEMGYLLLVKPFTDDLAWQVQEELVTAYFRLIPEFPELAPVKIPTVAELTGMSLKQAQDALAAAEEQSYWRHGKKGSAAMNLRRRELKRLRPAIARLVSLIQLTIPELEKAQ